MKWNFYLTGGVFPTFWTFSPLTRIKKATLINTKEGEMNPPIIILAILSVILPIVGFIHHASMGGVESKYTEKKMISLLIFLAISLVSLLSSDIVAIFILALVVALIMLLSIGNPTWTKFTKTSFFMLFIAIAEAIAIKFLFL